MFFRKLSQIISDVVNISTFRPFHWLFCTKCDLKNMRTTGQNCKKAMISVTYGKMQGIYKPTLRPHACTMSVQGDKITRRAISHFMASRYIAKIYITAISTKVTDPFTVWCSCPRYLWRQRERKRDMSIKLACQHKRNRTRCVKDLVLFICLFIV